MARFSERGWTSDFDPSRMTSDQIDRYVDGLRDDMHCRHDGGTKPRRVHAPAGYLSGFGTTDLIKHDYTLDVERAKAGDKEAQARLEKARRDGLVPVGITMAAGLAHKAMLELEERKRKEQAKDAGIAEILNEFKRRRTELAAKSTSYDDLIRKLEDDYYSGYFLAALELAAMYLRHPKFDLQKFEVARDWLNKACRNHQVDIGLLKLFLSVSETMPCVSRIPEHASRYRDLISKLQSGAFSSWQRIELVTVT